MEDQDISTLPMREINPEDTSGEENVPHCSGCDAICGLSKQANHKSELESRSNSSRKLGGLIVFCLIFIVVEVVGGVKANSLAVLTDAAHLLTDVTGFVLSLLAVWASGWEATPRHSFGFFRVEVLGALLSVQIIWLIVGFLIYEAIGRIWMRDVAVNGKIMFVTALFGFVINLIMVAWLGHDHSHHGHDHSHHNHNHHGHGHSGQNQSHHNSNHHGHGHSGHDQSHHGHDHNHCNHNHHGHGHSEYSNHENAEERPLVPLKSNNGNELECENQVQKKNILHQMLLPLRLLKQSHINMNVQGAYLHVVGDLIQSIGVMIGGALIWAKPNWLLVDLVCTLVFSVLVLLTTITMIRDILSILMESTPREIDMAKLESGLRCIRGVQAVHDLHVWAISAGC